MPTINFDLIRSIPMEPHASDDELPTLEDVLHAELARDPVLHEAAETPSPTLFDPPAVEPDRDGPDTPQATVPDRPSPPVPLIPLILTVHTGRAQGTRVPVQTAPFRIGRHSDCHLTVHHECVSRWHCTLHWHGRWWLRDDESTHGTIVNGSAIHGQKVPLDPGAEIVVGPLRLTVAADTRQPTLARFQFQTAVQAGLAVRLLPPTTVPVWPGHFPTPWVIGAPAPPVPRPQPRPAPARRHPPALVLPADEPVAPATEPIPLATDDLPVPVESAMPVETVALTPPAPTPVPPPEPTDQRLSAIYRNTLQPSRPDPKPHRSHPWSLLAATVLLTAVGAWYWFVPSGRHVATTERSGHFTPISIPPPTTPIRPPTKPNRPGRRGMIAPYYG